MIAGGVHAIHFASANSNAGFSYYVNRASISILLVGHDDLFSQLQPRAPFYGL